MSYYARTSLYRDLWIATTTGIGGLHFMI